MPKPTSLKCLAIMIVAALSISGYCAVSSNKSADNKIKTRKIIPDVEVYKTIADVKLKAYIYYPPDHKPEDKCPAILFFFGGGWVSGITDQFKNQSQYLASRGMVAICPEYRVKKRNGTTPAECVKDGNSAIRWARENALRLGIDPKKIVAAGGSAGGHVAAATATTLIYDESGEDLSISSEPNALVLFNPVYDNGPSGFGYATVKNYYQDISPIDNIRPGIPPSIVFLGTKDKHVPVATAERFKQLVEAVGGRSDLKLYQDREHGFFNIGKPDYQQTVDEMDKFLVSIGYLKPKLVN